MITARGKLSRLALLTVAVVACAAGLVTCEWSGGERPPCRMETVPVALSAGSPATYRLAGWLCAAGPLRGRPVQVLVHGVTYQHSYWDWPHEARRYSYVRAATAAGFATFTIDRLGVGASDTPPADALTVRAQAFVLSQVVRGLRSGSVAGTRFGTVIGVGHSGGAAMWMVQAATESRPDAQADALILAGFLHDTNAVHVRAVAAAMYPAKGHPAFATRVLPDGYLTTIPGTRLRLFHNPDFVDRRVVAVDEELKATTSAVERASLAEARDPAVSLRIGVPVLVATGQMDALACDTGNPALSCADAAAVKAREARYYSPAARLEVYVQPVAGHDNNLAPNARAWFAIANRWAGAVPASP